MLYSSDLSRPQGSFRTIPVGGSAIYAVKHVNKVRNDLMHRIIPPESG